MLFTIQVTETVTYTASQALASFQQQALLQHPSMEVTDEIVTTQEIHMEQPVPIQSQTATTSSTSSNTSHIKLPGITYVYIFIVDYCIFYCNCCNFISIVGFFY